MKKNVLRRKVLVCKKPKMGLLKNKNIEKETSGVKNNCKTLQVKSNSNECLSAVDIPKKVLRSNAPIIPLVDLSKVLISPLRVENPRSSKISLSLSKSKLVKKLKTPEIETKNPIKAKSITTPLVSKTTSVDSVINGFGKRKSDALDDSPNDETKDENKDVIQKEKKQKLDENESDSGSISKNLRPKKIIETKSEPVKKCKICHQVLNNTSLKLFNDHPEDALEEEIALTDSSLCFESNGDVPFHPDDARPSIKITHFSIYDKAGHLCPIDSGLIERNVLLYLAGYLKRIDADDPTIQDGVPVKDAGPINEWWMTGYDGGDKAIIGVSTPMAEYYFMEPHPNYANFLKELVEKVYISKLVIEFLLEEENPSFEDLLNKIQTSVQPAGIPKLTEDSLFKYAQFVSDQVLSFETALDDSVNSLITTPCMRTLVRLAAITFVKRKTMKKTSKSQLNIKKTNLIKASTTPLVKDTFDTLFTNQLDGSFDNKNRSRYQRCGMCEICRQPDCGNCTSCREKGKGSKKSNASHCVKRKCPNVAIQELDDSDPDDEEFYQKIAEEKAKLEVKTRRIRSSVGKKDVKWIGQSIHNDGRKTYYRCAKVGNEEFVAGDCVSVEPVNSTAPLIIGRIMYMWENKIGQKYMHVQWFCRGTETVLGETADPQELFVVDECDNSLLSCINSKVSVVFKESSPDWAKEGGYPLSRFVNPVDPNSDKSFFYQKRYNVIYGRFEDLPSTTSFPAKLAVHRFCVSCDRLFRQRKFDIISVDEKLEDESTEKEVLYGVVRWRDEEYRPGCCVFLAPHVFHFKNSGNSARDSKKAGGKMDKIDEELYPEYYRKSSDYVKGCNTKTPDPFCIGLITAIKTNVKDKLIVSSDIFLKVIKFYRPENTNSSAVQKWQTDLNMLYISDEEITVSFDEVAGKCTVVYSQNVEDLNTWTKGGPYRFYFRKAYNVKTNSFSEPSKETKQLGIFGKQVKGRAKNRSEVKTKEGRFFARKNIEIECWPQIIRPLRCLDVFAGCGGLSEGLHQSGVAETKWAIEHQEQAAEAFRLNNPNCTMFTEDCNVLLRRVMSGEKKSENGQKLPQKGEVELLCGGPPCQGFSGMNRFNSKQYYLFKNSLIVTYLSYCDYYRPKFFILENVRNFVSFKRSMVLKLTIRCLQRMGYQVAFGILQAGNYGVPQTRRRAIIIAAAPGEILPNFPEPLHVFNPRENQLTILVDDKKFISSCRWVDSAPYRTITVRDAISDLPKISNGAKDELKSYEKDPISHYQKMMRGNQSILLDHICKEMAPIVVARISHIPTTSGSDWRDLPNIVVKLSDDTYTQKLQYTHRDKSNKTGVLRGVCACAEGKSCNPSDRQYNTLIPWCLPHTGNRHNNWAGLYGRLEWEGFFSTTTTNPEPMSKQGRVLHPEQTRVISVRECARSQGFHDSYKFYGNILAKHRQVGNAVPPPLGIAIGRELLKSVSEKERNSLMKEELPDSKHVTFERTHYDTS